MSAKLPSVLIYISEFLLQICLHNLAQDGSQFIIISSVGEHKCFSKLRNSFVQVIRKEIVATLIYLIFIK